MGNDKRLYTEFQTLKNDKELKQKYDKAISGHTKCIVFFLYIILVIHMLYALSFFEASLGQGQ